MRYIMAYMSVICIWAWRRYKIKKILRKFLTMEYQRENPSTWYTPIFMKFWTDVHYLPKKLTLILSCSFFTLMEKSADTFM